MTFLTYGAQAKYMTTTQPYEVPILDLVPIADQIALKERFRGEWLTVEPGDSEREFDVLLNRSTSDGTRWCRMVGTITNMAPRRNKRPKWLFVDLGETGHRSTGWGPYED